ncbi:MAG: sigma-70 family RNA polymerase sigma factor [Candidatus Aminicenantes bacterium]|nr:sigma-70 family RNA polymerase sigma factor [Candidatus Aminicenantes bacterium]
MSDVNPEMAFPPESGASPEAVSGLVRRVRSGDREAFVALIGMYQKKVFVLAYSFFRNKEDAVDAVQDVFLRIYEKIDSFQDNRNFDAWLIQVAKNLCIDRYRRARGRREMESGVRVDEIPLADERSPNAERASNLKSALARSVDRLAERQKTIFLMRHVSQMGNEEIARALNISTGTVKSLHFKAIRRLRTLMGPHVGCQS